ncbi:MAG: 23S rRNA (guanosine(2251)-2'-O)-methyltransferase RlmB [Clostridia bacterium]|nr:23S rRNA (guanosine(2251)-2'-O)-methyltransferase RlmB [Clostridia bacterium]MDY5264320.1 23S rRNA (guanosine(2251)-2'-O)-methyltransferase RlmB [Eubacteriales bacterium]
MIIEGKNPVRELLASNRNVEKMYVEKNNANHELVELTKKARAKKIPVTFVDKFVLDKNSVTKRHQGILAVTSDYIYDTLENVFNTSKTNDKPLFLLILDGIEDPHNLGSIIRVGECCGVSGIVLPKHRAVGVTDTVAKISQGAIEHVSVVKVTNINDAIRWLKDNGVTVFCADMDGENIFTTNLTGDIAIVIGGENTGVKALTRKLCDGVISLPQFGKINSLNASVATGAILYEAIRQRTK